MKVFKITGAAFCGIAVVAGAINTVSPQQPDARTGNFILTLVFLILTILLVRSIRKSTANSKSTREKTSKSQQISPYLPEVPAEVLRYMKKHYTAMQAHNDIRIMQESFQLVQQTTDFDTFFSRLELTQQKALTLLQAAQAGCKGVDRKTTIKGCEAFLSNTQAAKTVFLDNSYKKETSSALQLKTKSGQYKRLVTYLDRLKSYEAQFTDVQEAYNGVISKLQDLIKERQPDEKSLSSRSKSPAQNSTADEIMKFKQLLDAGAITQEEYDAKKSQLLGV